MICYEKKAEAFRRAFEASGGDLVTALREADRATFAGRTSRLTPEQKTEMRRRRAQEGTKLELLAEDFGVSEATAATICRGIRRPSRVRQGADLIRKIGTEQGLPPGWERGRQRGKVPREHQLARRAALLAMRRAGLTLSEVAELLGKQVMEVSRAIAHARADFEAVLLADWALLPAAEAGALPPPAEHASSHASAA